MDDSAVNIRPARLSDVSDLVGFCAKQFTDAFGAGLNPADLALHITRAYSVDKLTAEVTHSNALFLVAHDAHGLAAYAYLLWNDPFMGQATRALHSPAMAHLERFYVDRRAHGSGIANALMQACVSAARARAAVGLWLTVWRQNPRAQRFYQKHQFEEVGEAVFVVGNDPQHDHVYCRMF
jgi:diamine N-acetyltransferase